MPKFSIVMPAYNAEKFIAKAINSVIEQTFDSWELVIVDDASTDGTGKIAMRYAEKENRIRYFKNGTNSGSANQPRLKAARMAEGKYIVTLDADDTIEPSYLEKLNIAHERTHADIVISQMIMIDETGKELNRVPKAGYDITQEFTGKEACSKTIGRWEIGFNGSSSSSSLYKSLCYRETDREMNADEVNTRLYLLKADKVALSDAVYYYLQNESSITKKPSLKSLDRIDTSFQLLKIVEDVYSSKSIEYKLQYEECLSIMAFCSMYVRKYRDVFSNKEKDMTDKKVKDYYLYLGTKPRPSLAMSTRSLLLQSNWKVFRTFICLCDIKTRFSNFFF